MTDITEKIRSGYLLSEVSNDEVERLSTAASNFVKFDLKRLTPFFKPGQKIIDIGCGTGEITRAIAKQNPTCQVFGVDADHLSLEKSQSFREKITNLQFHHWILGSNIPLPSAPFDVMFICLVLLHVPNPVDALRSLKNYLSPGGMLYVIDIDDRDITFSPSEPWQMKMLDIFQQVQTERGGSRHLGQQLGTLFEKAGYQVHKIEKIIDPVDTVGREAYNQMYLSMAEHFLNAAKEMGIDTEDIYNDFLRFCRDPSTTITAYVWHVIGYLNNS